jgi:quinate dehydrogenase
MSEQKYTYLAGRGVKHSIAPSIHNCVAKALNLPWTFHLLDSPTVKEVITTFRRPDFAGAAVTMPYKKTIKAYLDDLDETVRLVGSCNNVYLRDGKLVGSNTDWIGILGCLKGLKVDGIGKPALIVGAGGASNAAVYALYQHLKCKRIYIINRDEREVRDLIEDVKEYGKDGPEMIYLATVEDAEGVDAPTYIVSAIPDFEPKSDAEIEVSKILRYFLGKTRGGFLDMCFNPRKTRSLMAAQENGWETVEGINVIGHQIDQQYKLWTGEDQSDKIPHEDAWRALREAADASPYIN